MEEKWRKQNEAVMKAHPDTPEGAGIPSPASAEAAIAAPSVDTPAPAMKNAEKPGKGAEEEKARAEPQLPLSPP